jgi:hypothetical protein
MGVQSDPTSGAAIAAQATGALRTLPNVIGLCVVGSVARGDDRRDSDVDILVVLQQRQSPSELLAELTGEPLHPRLSLICKSPQALQRLASDGSLFLAHAASEGQVAYDPEGLLRRAFGVLGQTPLDTSRELNSRLASLRNYRHLDRFGNNFLFALAHLYGLGKGVAIARSARGGTPIFIKGDALALLGSNHPELGQDVEAIQRLRPFYDLTRGHRVGALPFSYLGAEQETRRAVQAVRRLADVPDDLASA